MKPLTCLPLAGLVAVLLLPGCPTYTTHVASDSALGRVVVYRSGIAFYERRAKVKDRVVTLTVPHDKVNDFLKSLTVADAKTGESHWTKRVGGGFSASPVYADGKIYFQSEQGEAIVIKPGLKYEELARNQFPGERTLASYAIADSALFIRTGTSLYRIQEQ